MFLSAASSLSSLIHHLCILGVLSVNAPLDYEQRSEYYLSVEGSRGKSSLSDVTMVIINITDVNDNPPIFNRGDYSAEVPEDIALDGLVMQVCWQSVLS